PEEAVVLPDQAALKNLQPGIDRVLNPDFQAQEWSARICLVRLTDQTAAILALADYVASDQADELLRQALDRGYVMARPSRYVLDAPLLLTVARQPASGRQTSGQGDRHASRTALSDAFQDLIEWGVRHDASDLHINILSTQEVSEVKYTIRGRYVAPARFQHMATTMLTDMLAAAWMDVRGGNGAMFDPRLEQQGSLIRRVDDQDVLIRWASLAADSGPSVCLRLLVRTIDAAHRSLASLGYLPDQIAIIERTMAAAGGAIVFAGTVGSGKSTSLASLIASLPVERKVITLEDPVEYRIPNAIQNTVTRVLSESRPQAYGAKLRTLKRSAMTDVLLGEIRDPETGEAFMDLTGSGINMYSTVHAGSAATVPQRLMSDFIGVSRDFILTPGTLRLLVFQCLMARLCPHCSLPVSALLTGNAGRSVPSRSPHQWGQWLEGIQQLYRIDVTPMRVRHPEGCDQCGVARLSSLQGYAGRTVVAELIEPGLQTDFLDSVREQCVNQWLSARAGHIEERGLLDEAVWLTAMDNAVRKALAGDLDPRDIERHFQPFSTRLKHRQLRQLSGMVSQPSSPGRENSWVI
ncbi:MAG TPA: ATPase, T2SS/T4P/T4SS family, partial [Burkholderiaceae bacterium]|nr:ATPase, T2SS/T4P/T4SS family [Burkholderiaceae bacterium]